MQPGTGSLRMVQVNATITHDGATVPMGIHLADVSTTRAMATGAGQRALTVVMRAGDKVLLIGDEADRFEHAWRGAAPAPSAEAGLTPGQRRYLQAVFDHFHAEGQWPTYWSLGRKLVRELDVEAVAKSLPPGFVNADSAWEAKYNRGEWASPAMLFLPALSACRGAEGELAAFQAALQLCLERYADPDLDMPEITNADLRDLLRSDELMVHKTALLLRQEPNILGSGGGDPGTPAWHHAISADIGRYGGVETIDEYVGRRPAPLGAAPRKAAALAVASDSWAQGGLGSRGGEPPPAALATQRITINMHDAREAVMLNEHGRRILDFLDQVYNDDQLDSSVMLVATGQGEDFLRASSRERGGADTSLPCDEQDVLELIELGYVTRGSGQLIRISAAGRQLVARDFAAPPPPAAGQIITISGGTVGNLSASAQGPATISGSPVTQGAGDLREALGQLVAAIDSSDLPEEARGDAKLEAAQLGLELDKATKNSDRIRGFLTSLNGTVAGSGQLVEAVGKLGDVLRGHGLI